MLRLIIACLILTMAAQGAGAEGETASNGLDLESATDFDIIPENAGNNEVFNIVVIGDSVAWGTGLNKDEKYSYLVANWIAEQTGMTVEVKIFAHTGATIAKKNSDPASAP
jgi:hypothetical protein